MHYRRPKLLWLVACWPLVTAAQDDDADFRLFEDVQRNESQQEQPVRPPNGGNNGTAQPEFTLVGTSRIGDRYGTVLQHRSGDTITVHGDPGANTRIPGYRDYALVHIGAGTVSIRYPDDNPCLAFPEKGVACNDSINIAALSLAHGEPLPPRDPPADSDSEPRDGDDEAAAQEETEETARTNPFEQIRAARAANAQNDDQQRDPNSVRFQPRRIAPEDVPDGMRLVSTPFGDRLVPD